MPVERRPLHDGALEKGTIVLAGAVLGTVGSAVLLALVLFSGSGGAEAFFFGGGLLLQFALVFGLVMGIAGGLLACRSSSGLRKPFLVALFVPAMAELFFVIFLSVPAGVLFQAYLESTQGSISGRVIDESGRPVEGIQVSLGVIGGVTDAEGHYRVGPLLPGDYYLAAKPGSVTVVPDGLRATGFGYALTYYPKSTSPLDARPVAVTRDDLSGVDITIVQTRVRSVSGMVIGPDGNPATNGEVLLSSRGGEGRRVQVGTDGAFAFHHVPPGTYRVWTNTRYISYEDQDCAAQVITVSDHDIGTLELVTAPAASVRGRLRFEGADVTRPDRAPWIRADLAGGVEPGLSTSVQDDWTFELTGLCGPSWIRVDLLPPEWWLRAVVLDGRDVTDVAVDFRALEVMAELDVILTSRRATRLSDSELWGRIVEPGQAPFGSYVIVFASDPLRWGYGSRFVRDAMFDHTGRFTIRGLPSADYLVAIIDPAVVGALFASVQFHGPNVWSNVPPDVPPDVLHRLRMRAIPFHLAEGVTTLVVPVGHVGQ